MLTYYHLTILFPRRRSINGHLQFWVTLLIVAIIELVSIESGSVAGSCVGASSGGISASPVDDGAIAAVTTTISSYLFSTSSAAAPSPNSCPNAESVYRVTVSSTSLLSTLPSIFLPLSLVTTFFCVLFSFYLHFKSYLPSAVLALGGDTSSKTYNYFIGRELNPRVTILGRTVDIKEWMELKPGLIGWTILNLSFARTQYLTHGHVSLSMFLLVLSQGLYVWDALYNERAILTTMDITTDGLGFMLCYGDLGWVPFTYTIQANYLLYNDPGMGALWCGACGVMGLGGYWIFRRSNSEKDRFRSLGPDSSPSFKYIDTTRGTKLLVSGWWGCARKINYTGDWILGLSWCGLTGMGCCVPYFYSAYFLVLLCHRALRDDDMCRGKYGKDWDRYKEKVPYVFVPGVV